MIRKSAAFILSALQVSLFLVMPPSAHAAILPITAVSAVLMKEGGKDVYYAKTPNLKLAPASTTKILTAIVAVENLELNQVITIPGFVQSIEPSKANLRPGDRYYVKDLIRATLISSANDAAETLGYIAGGRSLAKFSQMMNAKAHQIGADHSHFIRPSGLPAANHYSTAYDMALIMREMQKYPFLVETMRTRTTVIQSFSGHRTFLKNHNKMLWKSHSVIGKTGWTRRAKHCFVGSIDTSSGRVFVAMLGSRSLWKDLAKLINFRYGLSYSAAQVVEKIWSKKEKSKQIQQALTKAGFYKGPITGKIGKLTKKAIGKFQKAHHLPVTGRVGPMTAEKLQPFF